MGLDNLDQNYYDPNGEGNNHPWGNNSNYENWKSLQEAKRDRMIQIPENLACYPLTPHECHLKIEAPCLGEDIRIVRDRLNANKSRLAQEIQVKLTKTQNVEKIQELQKKIDSDLEKIEIWKNLQKNI